LAFSPDGAALAFGLPIPLRGTRYLNLQDHLRVVDAREGNLLQEFVTEPNHGLVQWSADGRYLAVCDSRILDLCDIPTGQQVRHSVVQMAQMPSGSS